MDKFQLILESLPYFGQGDDAGTDQVVRQVLQSAQVGDLEGRDEYGNTILILAVQYGAVDLVPIIMGKRAVDVNAVNSAGACALHFACYKVRPFRSPPAAQSKILNPRSPCEISLARTLLISLWRRRSWLRAPSLK